MTISIKLHAFSLLLLLFLVSTVTAVETTAAMAPPPKCSKSVGGCHDKAYALKLKFIAIAAILVTSMFGVCLPLFTGAVPALQPDRNYFVLVKAFASGVILATGYMHVMPDSFNCLTSECLPEKPWRKYPFTTFVAMFSAVVTLMVDSFAMSFYKKRYSKAAVEVEPNKIATDGNLELQNFGHCHGSGVEGIDSQLLRCRVIAQV